MKRMRTSTRMEKSKLKKIQKKTKTRLISVTTLFIDENIQLNRFRREFQERERERDNKSRKLADYFASRWIRKSTKIQ